jgi:hypothetical protein
MKTVASRLLNKQLNKIQSLIDTKQEWMEDEYYRKYAPIYDLAKKFLQNENVLIYGGTAINELIPKKHRFYRSNELPDFDVFSMAAKRLGQKAIRFFKSHGYDSVSLTEALHEDSFKCIVSGLTVIDITQVPQTIFDILKEDKRKTSFGLYTVNPQFLRMTLHTLLSQPNDSFRWEKMLKRILAFYKAFPPKLSCGALGAPKQAIRKLRQGAQGAADAKDPEIQKYTMKILQEETLNWVKERNYVVFSMDTWLSLLPAKMTDTAMNKILQQLKGIASDDTIRPLDILVDMDETDIEKSIQRLKKDWMDYLKNAVAKKTLPVDVKTLKLYYSRLFSKRISPNHFYILMDGIPIVGFYQTEACLSYIRVDNENKILADELGASPSAPADYLRVAGIQTILRVYLQLLLDKRSSSSSLIDLTRIECMINLLTLLSLESMIKPSHAFLKSFVLTCYGSQPGLVTLKRERFKRIQGR